MIEVVLSLAKTHIVLAFYITSGTVSPTLATDGGEGIIEGITSGALRCLLITVSVADLTGITECIAGTFSTGCSSTTLYTLYT
jgi:hypothetical protein